MEDIVRIEKSIDSLVKTIKEHHQENRKKFHVLNTSLNKFVLESEKDRVKAVDAAFVEADKRYASKWCEKSIEDIKINYATKETQWAEKALKYVITTVAGMLIAGMISLPYFFLTLGRIESKFDQIEFINE